LTRPRPGLQLCRPMKEIIAAIVGALAVYVFDLRKAAREREQAAGDSAKERRRERVTVASALLVDLRALEPILLQLYHHEKAGLWRGERPVLFLDALQAEVRGFTPETVQLVGELIRRVNDLFGFIKSVSGETRVSVHYPVRAKAGFALQLIPEVKNALPSEGGILPQPRPIDIVYPPDLPEIPPRSFPDVPEPGKELPEELR